VCVTGHSTTTLGRRWEAGRSDEGSVERSFAPFEHIASTFLLYERDCGISSKGIVRVEGNPHFYGFHLVRDVRVWHIHDYRRAARLARRWSGSLPERADERDDDEGCERDQQIHENSAKPRHPRVS
jgi:hypothetical protein